MTLIYQIDEGKKRLLYVARDRTKAALESFFQVFGAERAGQLKFVVSDMWRPYLDVVAEQADAAVHVLDRFHVMKKMNEAIDQVRREEVKRLQAEGYEPILKHSRWCLLKRPENRTDRQTVKLSELLQYNLRSVRTHLQREDFQRFWEYRSPYWAGRFLDEWCVRVMRSQLEPMKKVVGTLRAHRELLLNWFRAKGKFSAGVVEGFNNRVKLTMRKAFGFRTPEALEVALYHNLANLPEPKHTHRSW
jgi:transposase